MPYLVKKVKGGYKVGLATGAKMSNGRYYLSNKVMTKQAAEKQKKAVESAESKVKVKRKQKV